MIDDLCICCAKYSKGNQDHVKVKVVCFGHVDLMQVNETRRNCYFIHFHDFMVWELGIVKWNFTHLVGC